MFQPDGRIPPFRAPMPTPILPYPSFPPPVNGGELTIDGAGYARNTTTDKVLNGQFDITNATQDAYYANSSGGAWRGPNPAGMDPNMAFYNQAIAPTLIGANRTTQYALNHQPEGGGEGGAGGEAQPKKNSGLGGWIKDVGGFAAVGAGLGLVGGPFAPITSTAGAIGGAVIGGLKHLFFG